MTDVRNAPQTPDEHHQLRKMVDAIKNGEPVIATRPEWLTMATAMAITELRTDLAKERRRNQPTSVTVYGACWQDPTEPWGWAPIDDELYLQRTDAEVLVEEQKAGKEPGNSADYTVRSYALWLPPGVGIVRVS